MMSRCMLTEKMGSLKCCLIRYRTAFDQLKDLRGSLAMQVDDLAAAKTALLSAFEAWSFSGQGSGTGRAAGAAQVRGEGVCRVLLCSL